jgi:flagellar biosynthesis/type III secretory pathway protein FliH
MYSKMMNQKMFMKWLMDFKHREFVKDKSNEFAFYEIYKAIYEQAVEDAKEELENLHYVELESEYERGYEEGYRIGYEEAKMGD